jgi:hypothetical protein
MTGADETGADVTAAGNVATDKAVKMTKMARAMLMLVKSYRLDPPQPSSDRDVRLETWL